MRTVALAMAWVLLAGPLAAAERETIKTDWSGFRREVAARKLEGRSVRVRLGGAREIKTRLLGVDDSGVVIPATRGTKQWKTGKDRALITSKEITAVRFEGRVGKGGLIGGLAGLGAGAGVAAGIATSVDCYEGPCIIVLPVVLVGVTIGASIAGYYVGRGMNPYAPEFVLTP